MMVIKDGFLQTTKAFAAFAILIFTSPSTSPSLERVLPRYVRRKTPSPSPLTDHMHAVAHHP